MFVMDSIFVEPVVNLDLEINMVTEVSWSGVGDEELWLFFDEVILGKLLVGSLVIFTDKTEVSLGGGEERGRAGNFREKLS